MNAVQARVWPHYHNSEVGGPLDVKIGVTSQPEVLRTWNPKNKPLISLEQPQKEETNFTLLRVLFLKHGAKPDIVKNVTFHQGNVWGIKPLEAPPFGADSSPEQTEAYRKAWKKLKPSHITIYLKGRYVNTLPHPVPLGKWEGTVIDDEAGRWVLYTLQAVTLMVQKREEKRHILIPGDPDFEISTDYKKIIQS